MALGHANTMHLIATQPPDELQAIHDESAAMRETLYTDTMALDHDLTICVSLLHA
jgi:hypothetical protein